GRRRPALHGDDARGEVAPTGSFCHVRATHRRESPARPAGSGIGRTRVRGALDSTMPLRSTRCRTRRAPAAVMALSAMWLVGCDDPVQPQESLRPGRDFFVLRAGEVTRGAIEEAGDTVFYRLDAPKDVPLRLFFEAHADTLVAQVVDDRPGGDVWQAMASTVHDPMLAIRSTAWFRLSATESYHVRVFGFRASHRGDYSLYLYPLQTEPETVPPRFEIGDTVANEAIDVPGDVDVFYFQGAAGQEVIAFLQTLDGPDGHTLWLSIRDSARALEIRGTLGNAGEIGRAT